MRKEGRRGGHGRPGGRPGDNASQVGGSQRTDDQRAKGRREDKIRVKFIMVVMMEFGGGDVFGCGWRKMMMVMEFVVVD